MPRPHKSVEPNKLNVFNSKTEWNIFVNPYYYELTVLGVGSMPQNSGIWRIWAIPHRLILGVGWGVVEKKSSTQFLL